MSDTQILAPPPTALLMAAHQRVRELLARYERLGPEQRPGAFREIRETLEIHLNVEEALFYPALLGWESESARRVVDKALEDHRRMKELLEAGAEAIDDLRRFVHEHFDLEEDRVFPRARLLPYENQWELSRDMERLRLYLEHKP